MADWYLDSAASAGSGDGTSTSNAWGTIESPLSASTDWSSYGDSGGGAALNAGDIVWIRDNHAEIWDQIFTKYVEIDCVGSKTNPIIFRGDLEGEKWGDTGGRPLVKTAPSSNAYFRESDNDGYLVFEHIDFERWDTSAGSPNYVFDLVGKNSHYVFIDCNFYKYKGWHKVGGANFVEFIDCAYDGTGYTLSAKGNGSYAAAGRVYMRNTSLTGGSGAGDGQGSIAFFTASTDRSAWDLEDVTVSNWDNVFFGTGDKAFHLFARNLDATNNNQNEMNGQSSLDIGTHIHLQDINDNPRLAKHYLSTGTIWTVENVGGRDTIGKVAPNTNCHTYQPIKLFEFWVPADASVSTDYSVDFYATGWTTRPDETELVFEVGYYDTGSSSSRTWTSTTDTIDADDTWYTLTVPSISPSEDGTVILRAWLKLSEGSSEEIWFDGSGDFGTYWFQSWPFRGTSGGGSFMSFNDG